MAISEFIVLKKKFPVVPATKQNHNLILMSFLGCGYFRIISATIARSFSVFFRSISGLLFICCTVSAWIWYVGRAGILCCSSCICNSVSLNQFFELLLKLTNLWIFSCKSSFNIFDWSWWMLSVKAWLSNLFRYSSLANLSFWLERFLLHWISFRYTSWHSENFSLVRASASKQSWNVILAAYLWCDWESFIEFMTSGRSFWYNSGIFCGLWVR